MKTQEIIRLVVLIFVVGTSSETLIGRFALADPFEGSHTLRMCGDDNISDGFSVHSHTVDLLLYTIDGLNYTIAAEGSSLSLSMIRSGNRLSLNPRPQGTTINSYMLSDGVAGAFLLMVQEVNDPEDISINLATWVADTIVTGSQIAGDWLITEIEDTNLSNLHSPFSETQKTLSIVDLGDGLVDVHYPVNNNEYDTWRMKIVGNVLVALPETLEALPFIKHLVIKTDGYSLAMAAVGVEPWDATDISASIAFASRERPLSLPNIIGTWTGEAKLASGDGYYTIDVSMVITDQQGNLFRGTYTLGKPFSHGFPPISGIVVDNTFHISGDGIVGKFKIYHPPIGEDPRKAVGHWHSVLQDHDEGPIFLHTAKFELEEMLERE